MITLPVLALCGCLTPASRLRALDRDLRANAQYASAAILSYSPQLRTEPLVCTASTRIDGRGLSSAAECEYFLAIFRFVREEGRGRRTTWVERTGDLRPPAVRISFNGEEGAKP